MFCHCYFGRPAHGIEHAHAPDMAREVSIDHEISQDYLLKRTDMRINEAACCDEDTPLKKGIAESGGAEGTRS
jgi:hypothetical protein